MGILQEFVYGKVEKIERMRFESLRDDLREDVKEFKSAIEECRLTHSRLVNIEDCKRIANREELESIPKKLEDMEEKINSPLIQALTNPDSFQDQIIDCRLRQEALQRHIDMARKPENIAISEKHLVEWEERGDDLRALAILFEGGKGGSSLASAHGTIRELFLEVKAIQEDLDDDLQKLHNEPIGELKELDDMGERMNRLML
jgi:hypothetical protein